MSVVMNRAPSVEMTLLNRSFEVTTSLVLVVTSVTWMIHSVAACYDLHSSGFRFARAIRNNDAQVCGFAIRWHFVPVDEATSVCSFDFFVALEQTTDFIAERLLPVESVAALAQLRAFCAKSSIRVNCL